MDTDSAHKWIECLESGKYEHGVLQLRSSETEYCVFGVLADLLDPKGWQEDTIYEYSWNGVVFRLRENDLWRKCKFVNSPHSKIMRDLDSLNDESHSFVPVIEFIKNNYERL